MAIDLYALDAIKDYKKAIAALENYVDAIIDEFLEAPEGQSYIQANPDEEEYVGEWFLTVLEWIYKTEAITLPHITPATIETVLLKTLPQKLTPEEIQDAKSIIPELIAFWSFLGRAFRLNAARSVLATLKTIQPTFYSTLGRDQVSHKSNTNPVQTKQYQYDKNHPSFSLPRNNQLLNSLNRLDDLDDSDVEFDDDAVDLDLDLDDDSFAEKGMDSTGSASSHTPRPSTSSNGSSRPQPSPVSTTRPNKRQSNGTTAGPSSRSATPTRSAPSSRPTNGQSRPAIAPPTQHNGRTPTSSSITERNGTAGASLSPTPSAQEAIAFLTSYTITAQSPGPILTDIQAFISAIGDKGLAVSAKTQHLPLATLTDLNRRMGQPIELGLKRPQQKSFPMIHGLYVLLKASGLGYISPGDKLRLCIDAAKNSQWQALNPTEQYFTLLEAWMLRAETSGDTPSGTEGARSLQAWPNIVETTALPLSSVDSLSRQPGLHNLALMQAFGLLSLTPAPVRPGKGWQIQAIAKPPFGRAMMTLLASVNVASVNESVLGQEPTSESSLTTLQPMFQPIFPQWRTRLAP